MISCFTTEEALFLGSRLSWVTLLVTVLPARPERTSVVASEEELLGLEAESV